MRQGKRTAVPDPKVKSDTSWPCAGPTPRLKRLLPGATQSMPEYGTGRWVALTALLSPQGATEKELWDALRTLAGNSWNDFLKVNEIYGAINRLDGYGIFTDEGSGRTFAYESEEELTTKLFAARTAGFVQ